MPQSLNDNLFRQIAEPHNMPEAPQWVNLEPIVTSSNNIVPFNMSPSEYMAEYQVAFNEAMQDSPPPREPVDPFALRWADMQNNGYRLNDMYWTNTTERNKAFKAYLKEEPEMFEEFMSTGMSRQFELNLTDRGELHVHGQAVKEGSKICIITAKLIKASNARAKHLKKLLAALAKREGLELKMVDELPVQKGTARSIVYWRWKVIDEVDDSKLLVTQPKQSKATASSIGSVSASVGSGLDSLIISNDMPF